MKSKKSGGKGKASDKRSVKDLTPGKVRDVKGGSLHEMKKALIGKGTVR